MNNKTIPRRFNISSAEMALIVTVIIGVLVNSSQFATVDNAYNIVLLLVLWFQAVGEHGIGIKNLFKKNERS